MRVDADFEPLVTDRLVLRRSLPEDAEIISAYRSDPAVHRHQGWDRTDVEGVRIQIEEMAGRSPGEPGGWVQLSAIEREGGRLVGDVGLSPADGERGVMKVGYTVSPAFQRLGYATEAVAALVDYAFDVLGAEIVRIYANGANAASIRVAEKVGMRLIERIDRGRGRFAVRYELSRGGRAFRHASDPTDT